MVEVSRVDDSTVTRWLLRTDADHDIGLGHLQRMIGLAQRAQAYGIEPIVILKYRSTQAMRLVEDSAFQTRTIPRSLSLKHERRWLDDTAESFRASALVWDISHAKTPRDPSSLGYYLAERPGLVTCLIDGMADNALLGDAERKQMDLAVIPYAGAAAPSCECRTRFLAGPEYAIVSDAVRRCADLRVRHPSSPPRHLLVTAGGSDPNGITELVLEAISATPALDELAVKVVLGPMFGEERGVRLRSAVKRDRPLEYVVAPASLCDELKWADLAVSATGLTKYELAMFGVPAVFLSGDFDHHLANEAFSAYGTGIDLGPISRVSREGIAEALNLLVRSFNFRLDLARRGRDLVDGRGADRITSVILASQGNRG